MSLRTILIFPAPLFRAFARAVALVLVAASVATANAQEPPAKRLANVVGVAVDEYGKGVDASGKIFAQLEYDEAVAFLGDAHGIADRVADERREQLRAVVREMQRAVAARVSPDSLGAIHARLVTLLGPDAALDFPTKPIDLAAGRAIYARRCASCHGDTGAGDGIAAVGMTPPATALSDRELMSDVTPALMYRIVSVGIQGTAMPGHADLTSEERWAVVSYVTTLRANAESVRRGREILASSKPDAEGRSFAWLAERHDKQLLGAIAAADAALGLDAGAPLSAHDQRAVVAALRADAQVIEPPTRTAASIAATVMQTLDDALHRAEAGDRTAASDLAFDAYVAFEPLEATVRTRDPGMVALLERQFAEFKGAAAAGDIAGAVTARERIAIGLPQVVALSERERSRWGSFFESFLIIIREGLEAILILGAIVAFLRRTGNADRVREVSYGALAGLAASAVLAVVLRTLLVNAPASREVIEGATMLLAVAVLFSVSYWLLTKVETARWQLFIREKIGAALSSGSATALMVVAFLAVFREGAETALFYQALLIRGPQVVPPVIAGLVTGAIGLVAVWIAFHRFGKRIPLRGFFAVTSALLYALALSFLGKGLRELQEANVVSITPVGRGFYFEPLGIYPTLETLIAQGVLVALALFALWRAFVPVTVPVHVAPTVPAEPSTPIAPPVEAEADLRG